MVSEDAFIQNITLKKKENYLMNKVRNKERNE